MYMVRYGRIDDHLQNSSDKIFVFVFVSPLRGSC